jgi:hypothetical protein
MVRGTTAPESTTRVAKNGYHYTKMPEGSTPSWRLTHHLVAEKALGRLIDSTNERVVFDDGDRTNLAPENIRVVPKGKGSLHRQLASLDARISELQAQRRDVLRRLEELK